jgi:hexokinase
MPSECRRFRPGRRKMILGFCFSFPTQQTAIDHGTLIKWVKGFTNPGAEGEDVMKLLRDAFHRKVGRCLMS